MSVETDGGLLADRWQGASVAEEVTSRTWEHADYRNRCGTACANDFLMMDVALSIFALVAGGVTLELFTVARAPIGYQDERGFHFGNEAKESNETVETGNPS